MCQTRAFRHSCGHMSVRRLSSCRFTYASPNSQVPLCNADSSPGVTVVLDQSCQTCRYNKFMNEWQTKIDAARVRYNRARKIAASVTERDDDDENDDYWGGSEDNLGWGSCPTAPKTKASPSAVSQQWTEAEVQTALAQQHDLEREVQVLEEKFQREQWNMFNGFNNVSPSMKAREARASLTRAGGRRRSSPRECGRSPLKKSVCVDELPDLPALEEIAEDDESSNPDDWNGSTGSSSDSDVESVPTPSLGSNWADVGGTNGSWNWDLHGKNSKATRISSWASTGIDKAFVAPEDNIGEEDDDGMFPTYAF